MAKIDIFLDDLKEGARQAMIGELKRELLDKGEVDPRRAGETEEEFERRLKKEVTRYLKHHRSDNLFYL